MGLKGSKLEYLFKSLNINELKSFKKYARKNFVGKNEELSLLLELLFENNIKNLDSVNKQMIFEFVYGRKSIYNDLKVRHLLSELTRVLEDFIAFTHLKKNPVIYNKILLNHFLQTGVEKPAKMVINDLQGMMNDSTVHDADYYRHFYELGVANYHFLSNNVRTEDFDFSSTVEKFTTYTIIETLRTACTINAINKVMEVKIQHPLLNPILELLPESEYLDKPLVRIYFHLFLLVEHEQEEVFENLLQDIKENEVLFSPKDLNTVYRTVINFCIKKSNQNNPVYTRKAFEIYIYSIDNSSLIEHQEINRFIFTNVITLGIKLGELEQSLGFLESHRHLIHVNYAQNTIIYNLAKIYYAQKEFDKALKILFTNEFKDKIWNLNSKYLILKILFEQKELDTFRQQLSSFKVYVKRIQNVGYHKTYFEKVIQSLTILLSKTLGKKKYADYIFGQETPDYEWFETMSKDLI